MLALVAAALGAGLAGPATAAETAAAAEPVTVGTPGYWRLDRDASGVWWFLSPEGDREFLNAVTTVVPYQQGRLPGADYVSRDWVGKITGTLSDGDVNAWASKTLPRLKAAGFKAIGAWSHPAFHDPAINPDTPITRDLNLWTYTYGEGKRVFHPKFREIVEEAVIKQVTPLRDSKTLVGYFTDNELTWGDNRVGPGVYFDGLPPSDPSRLAVVETIRQLWPTLEEASTGLGVTLADWADLDAMGNLPHGPGHEALYHAFAQRVSTEYFKITSELVRKHDPNHLVLGVRYRGYVIPEVVRGQAGYTDVVSINYYVGDARLDRELFEYLHTASGGQPVMIGEYSFHALDGRSGNRNTFGFVAQVGDQQARAEGYEQMTRRLASVPFIVGADWFQWNDEPASGRRMDGEDVNFGIVDVDDHEYENLTAAIVELTPHLNDLHASSPLVDLVADVWRPAFENDALPVASLKYLGDAPRIDGGLRDWSEEHRLGGVRKNATVGAARNDRPEPTVYAGWNESGIYVAVEVVDPQIQAAAPNGPWWTQDALELFIATRGDEVERAERCYSRFDHQFFFVPNPFPKAGRSGTWGRWSRKGDALAGEHQIPAQGIADASRVLPGRYVTEIFIPGDQLVGFDPKTTRELRFNVHVRDYQTATEFYWSAPKEAATHFKPATWGRLVLEEPDQAQYASVGE